MNLGMLRYLPRDLVSTLIGVSPSEEQELFRRVLPRDAEHGVPLYSVAECRERLEEIRRQKLEETRREEIDEIRREPAAAVGGLVREVKNLLDLTGQQLARQKEQAALEREDNKETRQRVFAVTTAIQNAVKQPIHLSVSEVAKRAGLDPKIVRTWVRKGWFEKSLILGSRGNGKHKKFDPIKFWDDLESIKEKLSCRGGPSCATRKT